MSTGTLEGTVHRGCGGSYALRQESATLRISGMSTTVSRSSFRCDRCGHERNTIDQRDAAEKAAIEQIRKEYGLLLPREIRAIREAAGLTVEQFAELCYGTPKGIIEGWEKGRYLQNREADALIRGLADRETLESRARKAGVVLPDPNAPSEAADGEAVTTLSAQSQSPDGEVLTTSRPESQSLS